MDIKAKLEISLDNGERYTLVFDNADGALYAEYYLVEFFHNYKHGYEEGDITTVEGILDLLDYHDVAVENIE